MAATHEINPSRTHPGQWDAVVTVDGGPIISGTFEKYATACRWVGAVRLDLAEEAEDTELEPTPLERDFVLYERRD